MYYINMKKYQFKTNIMCNSCMAKVAPFIKAHPEIEKWEVDLESPDRILTVETPNLLPETITGIVGQAGYKAELLNQ
jgi:copper chaperone